jgi:hypothetical protein
MEVLRAVPKRGRPSEPCAAGRTCPRRSKSPRGGRAEWLTGAVLSRPGDPVTGHPAGCQLVEQIW